MNPAPSAVVDDRKGRVDVENLFGEILKGVLGARGKRHRGAWRYLAGGSRSFINASTLMGLAGVAWGLYETMASQTAQGGTTTPGGGWVPPGTAPGTARPLVSAPPLPVAPASDQPGVPPDVLRVIRLALSAARADSVVSDQERTRILEHARAVGAEAVVQREIDQPAPLDAIVGDVADPALKTELYTLAFVIVRADETVTGGERIYLAQLAHKLGLDPAEAARIEADVAKRIGEG